MKIKNCNTYIFLLIIAVALVIRLYHIGTLSIWYDESFSIVLADKSVASLYEIAKADVHPPLYYILLHFWMKIYSGAAFLRLFSVLFSIAAIVVTYFVAKEIFDNKVALLASFFLSIAPLFVHHSQEIRMYSLLMFFLMMASYFLWMFVKKGKFFDCLGYVLCSVCALYTHYFALFLIVAQISYLVFTDVLKKDIIKRLIVRLLIIFSMLLLYKPWLSIFFTHIQTGTGSSAHSLPHAITFDNFANVILTLLLGEVKLLPFKSILNFLYSYRLEDIYFFLIYIIFLFPIVYLIVRIILSKRKDENFDGMLYVLFLVMIPLVLSIILIFLGGRFYPRNLLIILPFYFIIVSHFIFSIKRLWVRWIIMVLLIFYLSASTFRYHKYFVRDVTLQVANYLEREHQENTAIFCTNPFTFFPLQIYLSDDIYLLVSEKVGYITLLSTDESTIITDRNFLDKFSSIWIILSEWSRTDHLKDELKAVEERWLDDKIWSKESEYVTGSVKKILIAKYYQQDYSQ